MALTARRKRLAAAFERLYAEFSRRDLVHPDPLEFLYRYERVEDREIAALVASSLAYGRVASILKSVELVLGAIGQSPRAFVESGREDEWRGLFASFRHRFTDGNDVAALLGGVKRVCARNGSLGAFMASARRERGSLVGALDELVVELSGGLPNSLLCRPSLGSACKRHFLMLRWLVRHDEVDPGGWDALSPAELLVPLDTHMFSVCRALRFTRRSGADLRASREITDVFLQIRPDDPVRYDFALTRYGIRAELSEAQLLRFLDSPRLTGKDDVL